AGVLFDDPVGNVRPRALGRVGTAFAAVLATENRLDIPADIGGLGFPGGCRNYSRKHITVVLRGILAQVDRFLAVSLPLVVIPREQKCALKLYRALSKLIIQPGIDPGRVVGAMVGVWRRDLEK